MRQYQQLWNSLRDSNKRTIKLNAAPKFHRRIYKAVIKEKDMDLVFKLQLADNYQRSRLTSLSEGNILTITLILSLGLTDTTHKI